MSDVAVQSTHRPSDRPPAAIVEAPQFCQLRALLWKEWREQRLVVAGLLMIVGMIIGLAGVRYRLPELDRDWLMQCATFCYVITGWVLGRPWLVR